MAINYYVKLVNGQWAEVQNVEAITIASPLIANGTYRDTPPPVTGAAAASTGSAIATVVGGVDITPSGAFTDTLIGNSSIDEDDRWTHEPLRFVFSPIAGVFFTTVNFPTTTPNNSSFSMTRPTVNFEVVTADVFFKWDEIIGWTNVPPPGFSPFTP